MRSRRLIFSLLPLALMLLLIVAPSLVNLYTDWIWFDSVDQLPVLKTRLGARWGFTAIGLVVTGLWLAANLLLAARNTDHEAPIAQRIRQLPANIRKQAILVTAIAAGFVALIVAMVVGEQWETILQFTNSVSVGVDDPVFGEDIGYYLFQWPFWKMLSNWALWLVGLALVGTAAIYTGGQLRYGTARLEGSTLIHLTVLAAGFLAIRAWAYHLQRYDILYSVHGALHGAGYTDIHVRLPAYNGLAVLLGIAACLMLANILLRKVWLVWVPLAVWAVASVLMLNFAPAVVQRLSVTPNELSRERPYIEQSIIFTRQAYGLDAIETIPFLGDQELTSKELAANEDTLVNTRLWDWKPLQSTYRQLQEIRTYYEFGDVDVERYHLEDGPRSVMLAAREMRIDQLTDQAKTWVNEHLVFTHGYGVVLNAVNEVTEEGLPLLLVQDIPPTAVDPALEINRPEIYFGEMETNYVIVGTSEKELDYPQGDANIYTRYQGRAGVLLDSLGRRLAFAIRYGDLPLLISQSITDQSRILIHREIRDRIETVAPFLMLDADPYIVISEGRLFWIQDCYTVTDNYPYSEPYANSSFNYIRNSVKVVIDAYNGDMRFFVADGVDPILRTYQNIFPELFSPYSQMPADLREHIRYPEDIFQIQAEMFMTYHMQDAQVFYNREDMWQSAIEIRGSQETRMTPYFVIMRLLGNEASEFLLMLPLTPAGKDNMIAWLYADSDGDDYGQMGVLQFSKQELVYGPRQIEARIDQDTLISQQLSLWNQQGSQVIRGNMMVIPIDGGLIYVEPIFLQAETGRLPELKRVIVAHGSHIAMQETFADALAAVFGDQAPAGVQPVEGEIGVRPGDIRELAQSAQRHYDTALECLELQDWACYGREQQALQADLEAMVALTSGE